MANSEPTTLRLQNLSFSNLSLHLAQLTAPSAGSLRHGAQLLSIVIAQGHYYDVCAQLNISVNDARKLLASSPEVNAFRASNLIQVIEWPPPPEVAQAVVAPAIPAVVAEPVVPARIVSVVPAPVETAQAPSEPSMDWSEAQLRAYAKAQDIDVTHCKSKTAVLRVIRGVA